MTTLDETIKTANAYQDAARDVAGLITLLHRHLAGHAQEARGEINHGHVADMRRLRIALIEILIPTRNCLDEAEAKAEIASALAVVRPHRV